MANVSGREIRSLMNFDRSFWAISMAIIMIGSITWRAIFEHNYHPRI